MSIDVNVLPSRADMGKAAAGAVAAAMQTILSRQERVRMVFAAAPSQVEFLNSLVQTPGLEWGRVEAFHMDEYIGLPEDAEQTFGFFLRTNLFNHVSMARVEFINPDAADSGAECRRYAVMLREHPVDIVCMGIGENGHIAFNDPPVADFGDPEIVKIVELDQICRTQQVNDGCFSSIDKVPRHAITLTVPALLSTKQVFVVVPGPRKARAVFDTLRGPISTACPASILRTHACATLFLDNDSSSLLV
jgi:glucosamine-6-phosphate deaminase